MPTTIPFLVAVDGVASDRDMNGTFESTYAGGDVIPVQYLNPPAVNSGADRGVFEFDLSRIAPGTTVQSAKFGFYVTSQPSNGPNYPLIEARVYQGDGVVTASDGNAFNTLGGVANIYSAGYQEIEISGLALQPLLGGKVTVRLDTGLSPYTTNVAGTELGGVPHATLTLTIPTLPTFALSVTPGSVPEHGGPNAATGTLTRTGDISQALTVGLGSSDVSEATTPTSVTFGIGQSSVSFPIAAVDDVILDGTQTVQIQAGAFLPGDGPPVGLDTTFGSGGLASTRLQTLIQPPEAAIARQADGKVVVAGENGSGAGWRVQRFNADGTPDQSFGSGGFVDTSLAAAYPSVHDIVIQPDGKILVGGKYNAGFGTSVLARYNPNGSLDTTFGAPVGSIGARTGIADLANVNGWIDDMAVRPDGRILLAVAFNGSVSFRAVQLLPNGQYDTSFFGGGIATYPINAQAQAVRLLPDGKFLLGGDAKVARFLPGGGLDTTFAENGVATLNFGAPLASVFALDLDGQGRIAVGAYAVSQFVNGNGNNFTNFAAARLMPDGAPDASFAGDGTVMTDFPAGLDDVPTSMVVQPDGRIVLAGYSETSDSPLNRESALVRYNYDGSLDFSFDDDGRFQQSLVPHTSELIYDVALQDDGKLLALGGFGNDYRLARFLMGPPLVPSTASANLDVLDNEIAANHEPSALFWNYGTLEDVSLNDLLRATDADNDPLVYTVVAQPTRGTLVVNKNTGEFVYTPAPNDSGTISFSFKVSDGRVDSNVAVVNIDIQPVNDAPKAIVGALGTNEDTPASGALSASDVDNTSLVYSIVSPPTHGAILNLNAATGAFTYRPSPNYNGPDSFTFKVRDGALDSNIATLTIAVAPVNDAPIPTPVNRSASTNEDTPVGGQLVAFDVENDPLTFSGDVPPGGAPSHGSVVVNPNGTYTYTPALDFNGTDQFVYKVSDDKGAFNYGIVTVRVLPVNDAPVVRDDSYGVDEDGVLDLAVAPTTRLRMVSEPGDFIGQGPSSGTQPLVLDYNSSTATFTARTNFDNGVEVRVVTTSVVGGWTLEFAAPGDAPLTPGTYTGAMRWPFQDAAQPGLDVSGNGRGHNMLVGTFTISDVAYGPSGSITRFAATFVQQGLDFDSSVDPPLSGAILFNTTFGAGGGVLANDSDPDGDVLLTTMLVDAPAHGSLVLRPDGTFRYTPNPDFNGIDTFTYRTSDGNSSSAPATATINVRPVNDTPVAKGQALATNEDTALTGAVSADDVDGGAPTYAMVSGPAHGTLTLNANGSFTYTPAANYNGPDSFAFKANDGSLDSNVAVVSINVRPVNDAPVANGQSVGTDEDTALVVMPSGSDVEGSAPSFALVGAPAHGSVVQNADGTFTYTPAANYNGPDSFTFEASDGSLDSARATVSVTVRPINDAPVAQGQTAATDEDKPLTGAVAANDVDGGTPTYAMVSGPAHGTLTLNANGSFMYMPAANYNGPDSFAFKANDGSLDSNVATVNLNVRSVNDAPTLSGANFSLVENTLVGTFVGAVSASDVDGDRVSYSIVAGNNSGAFAIDPNTGRITVANASALDFERTPTFLLSVQATDPAGLAATATVRVDLTDVPEVQQVVFDILPGDSGNTINSKSHGKFEVAILSTSGFDASTVDVESLRFGRTGLEDSLSRQGKDNKVRYRLADVNGDGRLDLVVTVEIELTAIRPGDVVGVLTGRLADGSTFRSQDSISVK